MTDQPIATPELADQIAALLDQALSRLARDETGARVYSIEDAAARLNMAPRTLTLWCRAGMVSHTKIGKSRGLTARQIDMLAAQFEQPGTEARPPVDDLELARQQSLRTAAKRSRRANVA